MRGVREHVDGADGFHLVELLELDHFAGEVLVVAGHVDNAFRLGGDNVGQRFVHHAGARRVEDDDVGAELHPVEGFGFNVMEFYVDVVELGVNASVADSIRYKFNTDCLLSLASHGHGEETGAAVQIEERLICKITGEVADCCEEHWRGVRVGLEEGVWGNAEFDSFDGFVHDAVAVDNAKIVAERYIGNSVIDAPDGGVGARFLSELLEGSFDLVSSVVEVDDGSDVAFAELGFTVWCASNDSHHCFADAG